MQKQPLQRYSNDDVTQAKALDLLARYRLLCENAGACRATDTPYPKELREQLALVEGELQTRLWMNSGGASVELDKSTRAPRATAPGAAPRSAGSTASNGETRAPRSTVAASRAASIDDADDLKLAPLTPLRTAMVYCDGACQGNPGPGGFGTLVRVPGHSDRTHSAGKARTTNNEMELTGAAEGLKLAISMGASEITVVSDSEYLVKGMSGWVKGWLRNGWKTAKGEPVKNRPLWEELHQLCQGRTVSWSWIRGHNGHAENERCDAMAVAAAQEARSRR